MFTRRFLLAALPAAAMVRPATAADFGSFLAGIRAEARGRGIGQRGLAGLDGLQPNARVLQLNAHQPEFTETWAQYSAATLSATRISQGRALFAANRGLLAAIGRRFGVDAGVIMGIWGLETNYGHFQGGFNVPDALATLAWDSGRSAYFRSELLAVLRILDRGGLQPAGMLGSYAGAMGQPQFMPSVYLRLAVSFNGNGTPDIWTSVPDSLASIANYLHQSGWRPGEPWGEPALVPSGFPPHRGALPLAAWERMGLRRLPGSPALPASLSTRLLRPAGVGGDAFFAYPNFRAIRAYNPSDFYALSVGLLGNLVTS